MNYVNSCILALSLTVCASCVGPSEKQRAIATGVVGLSWRAPTRNVDGSPIFGSLSYLVYYGQTARNYTSVSNAGTNRSIRIVGLTKGMIYYFSVTTRKDGVESAYSKELARRAR